jgi:hypothetical protein
MITTPTRTEIRQNWTKGHEWIFSLERDKLVMNATEKGNHFHNDIPLDQIDPYESEEKFFLLRWPMNLLRLGGLLALICLFLFGILALILHQLQWWWLAGTVASGVVAGIGLAFHLKKHRTLMRFYHRMSGMELFAVFADLPNREEAGKFIEALKKEIPPWSYTFGGPSKTENLANELKALHQLRKDKILTDEEFQFKKREILTGYFHHGRDEEK